MGRNHILQDGVNGCSMRVSGVLSPENSRLPKPTAHHLSLCMLQHPSDTVCQCRFLLLLNKLVQRLRHKICVALVKFYIIELAQRLRQKVLPGRLSRRQP